MAYTHENSDAQVAPRGDTGHGNGSAQPSAWHNELNATQAPPADTPTAAKPAAGQEQAAVNPSIGAGVGTGGDQTGLRAGDGAALNRFDAAQSPEARMSNEAFDQLKDKGWSSFAGKDAAALQTDGKGKKFDGGYDSDGALDMDSGSIVSDSGMSKGDTLAATAPVAASTDGTSGDGTTADGTTIGGKDPTTGKPGKDVADGGEKKDGDQMADGIDRKALWGAKVDERVAQWTDKADKRAENIAADAQAAALAGTPDISNVRTAERMLDKAMDAGERRSVGNVNALANVKGQLEKVEQLENNPGGSAKSPAQPATALT